MRKPDQHAIGVKLIFLIVLTTIFGSNAEEAVRWWKGNLHTHSLWSDGNDYPEVIALWYKDHGYNFLSLTDHNTLSRGKRWSHVEKNKGGPKAFARYLKAFGANWVETRAGGQGMEVRLKPLTEFRSLLESPGEFIFIEGEEVTDRYRTLPIHLNASNLENRLDPQGGASVSEVIQNNLDALNKHREETQRDMILHLNHPNFGYAVTAEDLIKVKGQRFIEIYNGHPSVHNEGDGTHASVEKIWDIVLSWKLGLQNETLVYGLAVDDGHDYFDFSPAKSNPGRGWIQVESSHLTPERIIQGLENGRFYASSGVEIVNLRTEPGGLGFSIQAETGIQYTTQFIGTKRGFNTHNAPVKNSAGEKLRVTHRYSDEVGQVLLETNDLNPFYKFDGDEIYVRARIHSSRKKDNPYIAGEVEKAWIQPIRGPAVRP